MKFRLPNIRILKIISHIGILFTILSLVLGFSLAVFIAYRYVPLFPFRRLFIQAGFLILATFTLAAFIHLLFHGIEILLRPVRKSYLPLFFLIISFVGIYITNNVIPLIDTTSWHYTYPSIIPTYDPVGIDFRGGLYRPAQALMSDFNLYPDPAKFITIYPPLVNILALPYLLLSENDAYLFHLFLLFISNIFCLAFSTLIAKNYLLDKMGLDGTLANSLLITVFLLVLFNLFSGYPFLFSIERGNIDIFAMIFCLSSLWVLLRHPNKLWLQIILLSIAVHIKIYPIVLFALLFYRHRFKILVPTVVVNVTFLLCLGPINAIGFINTIAYFAGKAHIGIGNHSAYSFAGALVVYYPEIAKMLSFMRGIFTFLPVLIWILAWIAIFQIKNTNTGAILGFMISIPVMEIIPSVSNAYKLVISASAELFLIVLILIRMVNQQRLPDYIQLFLIAICLLFIGRSFVLLDESIRIFSNEYPWLLILELLMAIGIYQYNRQKENPKACSEQLENETQKGSS